MSATLQVLSGPEAGCRYEFGETEILIGRDENCSVVLHSRAISRRHARLYFQSDRYWLEYYHPRSGACERPDSREPQARSFGRWRPDRDLRLAAGVPLHLPVADDE